MIAAALIVTLPLCAEPAPSAEPAEPRVTLNVKAEDVHSILRSMQEQCEIRNLVIDSDVQGTGTFYFRDVPCGMAFRVVLRTLGLRGERQENSVVHVRSRQ